VGEIGLQNNEIIAKSINTERGGNTMDERVEDKKREHEKTPQYAQKTTRRNRNQTLQEHQKSKTLNMDSKAVNRTLLSKQISQPLS